MKPLTRKIWITILVPVMCLLALCGCAASKPAQTTSKAFMVRPIHFAFNRQTASSNAFQKDTHDEATNTKATAEFDNYVRVLRENKIDVVVAQDTEATLTPDSIFPNNWFTTHEDGTLVLYPMNSENRRAERKPEFLDTIKQNFNVKKTVDLTHYEGEGQFLEGTGSMVLDRQNKIVYACRSPRTSEVVLDDFCKQLGYTKVVFDALDKGGKQIYHTNVMMSVGEDFAILCKDSIATEDQRQAVISSLEAHGKKPIFVTFDQMDNFAGNMIEMKNSEGTNILLMSDTAYGSLSEDQLDEIKTHCQIVHVGLNTVEVTGGGSARCMIAELY